ncbi:hypothetical protein [Aestuariivirga sp.]|jgi:hypothetical protein|uniref:hypothetical protein n=1 Tax=Aestuariivirga sp. TaxID=2650926 RepID=UPI003BAA20AE
MLRLVFIGIWVILVTAGATFASVYLGKSKEGSNEKQQDLGVEEMKSEMTSIPVIRGDNVVGYVIFQLSFAADRAILEQKKLDPMPYLTDAAFRVIFTSSDTDFRKLKAHDLDKITIAIAEEANRRLGEPLVRQVLLQQLNYVRKEDIRTNWIGGGDAAE